MKGGLQNENKRGESMERYYLINVWADAKKMGKEFKQVRRLKTAEKWLEKLKESGRYEMIVLREETVYWDTVNSILATSAPIIEWKKGGLQNEKSLD